MPKWSLLLNDVIDSIISGDIRTVARLISDIDNGLPDVRQVLKELYPYTGRAYIIGITGAPGVGKSTLVDKLIDLLRNEGKSVGVIAVDPTSPFSGGALLGDRIRMQRHSNDKEVYIRSLATRGHFGGLTLSTRSTIDVLDAMGKDFIIVETVGVGQDEVEIAKNAHTTIIVVIPGMGDDIQAIKAGILEAGDVFVINKSRRDGADRTLLDLRAMIETNGNNNEKWIPPIVQTEAIDNVGVTELLDVIIKHREYLIDSGDSINLRMRRDRTRDELQEMLKARLVNEVFEKLIATGKFEEAVDSILNGETDPYTASERLIPTRLGVTDK
jgi:LAO/AO transport system kinase